MHALVSTMNLLMAGGLALTTIASTREDYFTAFGRYEPKTPVLSSTPSPGFHGRVTELERITPENAVGAENRKIVLSAWRGERVHAQTVVWTDAELGQARAEVGELRTEGGNVIPKDNVSGRIVRYVLAIPRKGSPRYPDRPELFVGDILDDRPSVDIPANGFRPFWFTVEVPRTAVPGTYRGAVAVKVTDNRRLEFPVELTVRNQTLPKKPEFFLDVWQNPWAVARYHGVRPFSKIHYEIMRPLYEELASVGQKVITATLGDYPWNKDEYFDNFRAMIKYTKRKDGSWTTDYSLLDEYVAFAESCGIGPQIHCYSMVKFGQKKPLERKYYYIDEATGDEKWYDMTIDDPRFEAYWKPFLEQFEEHVKAKGWVGRLYIAIDEFDATVAKRSRELLSKYAPSIKFAMASDKMPMTYFDAGVRIENFSQSMRGNQRKGNLITPEFLKTIPARRAAGMTTTYYICNFPEKPNTWVISPLIEAEWHGLYVAAQGFDGLLRWAAFHWPRDPMYDTSYGLWEPGEAHLIYPGALASTRWELLKSSVWNCEKIRLLRDTGKSTPELEAALAKIDYLPMCEAPESEYRLKVNAVKAEIDKASSN